MRITTLITELTDTQWSTAQEVLKNSYEFGEESSRVCLILEHGDLERHVELPIGAYTGVLARLALTDVIQSVAELDAGIRLDANLDPVRVRNNCAFCHRERSAKDDNHADDCPYWTIGPGSIRVDQ